jgi:hypothetical protein
VSVARASSNSRRRWIPLAALGLLGSILTASACSFAQLATSPPTASPLTTVYAATPLPTIEDTPTALPPKVVLVAPEEDAVGTELESTLTGLASEAGFEAERAAAIPSDAGWERVRVAVVVSPIDNLATLAESLPGTEFVAIGLPGLSPTANLTVVQPLADRVDDVAFLGGYLAALVSDDWRVASISQLDSTDGATTRLAFANGAEFLCGLCRPQYPPYAGFPLDYQVAPEPDTQAVQSVLAQIDRDRVEVVFIQQGINTADIIDGLSQQGVRIIGVGKPGTDSQTEWIAALEGDPTTAINAVWPTVVSGESAGTLELPVRLVVYDPTRLTPGRLRLFQTVDDDLENGFIATGVDPITGEPN